MKEIFHFIRFALVMALAGTIVFLCLVCVRVILQKLLLHRLLHIYEAIKPLFDPTYNYADTQLERAAWSYISAAILLLLTFALAIYLWELFEVLWDVLFAI